MKASIVLPNLNGAGWMEGCIESLYAMTVQDFELIIVDNGSTDESLETARRWAAAKPNCTLVENGRNTGFSAAVNLGIGLAQAPYVLLFNNDAFAQPDMLEHLLAEMEKDERVFAVQCLMLKHFQPELVDDAGDFVTLIGWAFQRGSGLSAAKYTRTQRVFSACGGASLYRRSVFDQMGGFEEKFFAYNEDIDVGWRANILGWRNILCPAARCTHIGGATTSGTTGAKYNTFKSIQSGRNNFLLPYKNMPLLMLVLNLIFLIPGYLLKMLVFHLRGFGKPWRQGMKEAFALLGKLDKPKFRFKNLPNYLWIEWSLFISCFRFAAWRLGRVFKK